MVKPRYSFSSRHTGKRENIRKQRKKYPSIASEVIGLSDIILEILDAIFIRYTINK
jgi:ribosome biogenesis GTPase A